jgi:signal transduction histidine kinase
LRAGLESDATFLAPGWDELLEGVRRDGQWALDRTTEGLRSLPTFVDLDDETIRSRLGRLFEALLAGLELRRRPSPSDLADGFFEAGIERARQGVAASDMAAGFRIGQESIYLLACRLVADSPHRDRLLREFLELVMSWIDFGLSAAAEGHRQTEISELRRLADEQASLRRVAMLVARGVSPTEVFSAVSDEVARLFNSEHTAIARFEGNEAIVVGTCAGIRGPWVGWHVELEDPLLITNVHRTGRPGRRWSLPFGPIANYLAEGRRIATVAAPIMVEGRVWGVMIIWAPEELPPDTEQRLESFTELVAAAIANADARAEVQRLAEEQAALRRVATLVAKDAPPAEVFASAAEGAATVIGDAECTLVRDEGDGTIAAIAVWGAAVSAGVRVGMRMPSDGDSVVATVLREGRPHRLDDYSAAGGSLAEYARTLGIRCGIGWPVTVGGRVWGVMAVQRYGDARPFPPQSEARLGRFAELVATAIANVEARAQVERLAEEQAALRRVATLIAREAPQAEVFAAIGEECARLFGIEDIRVGRFEGGDQVVVASEGSAAELYPVGSRQPLGGRNTASLVARTGRPARVDDYQAAGSGEIGEAGRAFGMQSVVAAPIIVEGRLWGAMQIGSKRELPLPPDTESRLGEFTELMATAIANVQARSDLATSRARIVVAGDEERRRVVRDLHDGAQQRLVHTLVTLKHARRALEHSERDAAVLVDEALGHAQGATDELRELAHGILPSALTIGGLDAGIGVLASRMTIPVLVDVTVGRLPEMVESTAYFIVAEALTNVAKHAHARQATVTVRGDDQVLRVEVRDDGIGGAQFDGQGLVGLRDRLAALDGILRIESPAGGGTQISASMPMPPAQPGSAAAG